ncbi:MAG: hypothetical protein WCY34_02785 [Candidatus Omnitrophota bacterium]|jgi:ABC-type Na+ efflux pump permease subunit
MKKIFCLACLSFREAVREKFFFGAIFFFFFYLGFCALLSKLSVGYSLKVLQDAGFIGIELTAVVLVVFSFVTSFFKEKETSLLQVYLSNFKPREVIIGKILGYVALSFLYLILSSIFFGLVSVLHAGFTPQALVALYPVFLKTVIIIGFASLFSALFSSSTLALLATLFIYLSSEALPSALVIVGAYGGLFQKGFLRAVYFMLPQADKFEISNRIFYSSAPGLSYFFWITLYSIIYAFILWIINLFIFQKNEY